MLDQTLNISSILGIGSGQPKTNPILELRKLQSQISSSPALSVGDQSTRIRLQAERSGIQSRSSLFGTLETELGKLNSLAQDLSATRLIDKKSVKTVVGGTDASASTNNSALGLAITGEVKSGGFSLSVGQLATQSRFVGSTIASTVTTEGVYGDSESVQKTNVENGTSYIHLKGNSAKDQGDSSDFSSGDRVKITGGGLDGTYTLKAKGPGSPNNQFQLLDSSGNAVEFDKNLSGISIQKVIAEGSTKDVNISANTKLNESNLAGFSGQAGSFQINGKSISFSGTDTFGDLINKINDSGAGVTASLDETSRTLSFTSNKTGSSEITVTAGDTGLAAGLGLTNGTSTAGKDAKITVDGTEYTSASNSIDGSSFGVSGVKIDIGALGAGSTADVTLQEKSEGKTIITADPETVKAAVKDFFEQYNKVQSFLEANSADGGRDFSEIATGLRQSVSSVFSNSTLSGAIAGSGTSNQVNLNDKALDGVTGGNVNEILNLFRSPNGAGFAAATNKFLSSRLGSSGSISREISRLEKSDSEAGKQLSALSEKEEKNRMRLNESLAGVSQALIAIQTQKSFLSGLGSVQLNNSTTRREGTTGLDFGNRLSQITSQLNGSANNSNSSPDLGGIVDFLSQINS